MKKRKPRTKFEQMNDLCVAYRGAYIHLATRIEQMINKFLADYFCGHDQTKNEEILYGLFFSERVSMGHKVQLLQFIISNHFKEIQKKFNEDPLIKYNNLPKAEKKHLPKPPTLNTHLNEMIEVRNKFAHRPFLQTDNDIVCFDGENIALDIKQIKDGVWKDNKLDLSKKKTKEFQENINIILIAMNDLNTAHKRERH